MEVLIERLEKEKAEAAREQFGHGVEVAKLWAEEAHYSDIKEWATVAIRLDGESGGLDYAADLCRCDDSSFELPEEFKYNSYWWEEQGYDEESDPGKPYEDEEWIQFGIGFFTGLIELWEILEDKV